MKTKLFVKKYILLKYVVLLSFGLAGLSDARAGSSSPSSCSDPVHYDVLLNAKEFYQNPKLHFKKIKNRKAWLGKVAVFDGINELPLAIVHLDKETLVFKYLILPYSHASCIPYIPYL